MRTTLQRPIAAAIALALLAATPAAQAQSAGAAPSAAPAPAGSPDGVTQAGEHFAHGVKLYQEDDFRAAVIEFTRAYELAPNWAVLYNIGQSQYQLRDYVAALKTLEKYVEEGGDRIQADRRSQVDREIGELRGRVAHITVVANVGDADVALDDTALGKASANALLLVGEGRHRLTASRAGFLPATKVVDIAGGDTLTVRLELTAIAASPPPPRESPSYTGAIVVGTIGVAGVAAGAIFGVLTVNDRSSLNSACTSAKVCPPSSQSDINAYSRDGTISGVAFGVGAVGLIAGGYLYFHARAKEPPAQASITPWIGPGAGGLSGTF
jgi:PEGA domain